MFFITLYRLVNDTDFIKYAGLQACSFLFAFIASMEQLQAVLTVAATFASFTLSVAGIVLVWFKVKKIRTEIKNSR